MNGGRSTFNRVPRYRKYCTSRILKQDHTISHRGENEKKDLRVFPSIVGVGVAGAIGDGVGGVAVGGVAVGKAAARGVAVGVLRSAVLAVGWLSWRSALLAVGGVGGWRCCR